MAGDEDGQDEPWPAPRRVPGPTDEEIKALRYITPAITNLRSAGVVVKWIAVGVKWGGCIILFGLALKDGLPLSQLIGLWTHG